MDEIYNKHYIDVDDRGRIIGGFSDGPHSGKSADGYILLRSDGGYQFRLYAGCGPGQRDGPCGG